MKRRPNGYSQRRLLVPEDLNINCIQLTSSKIYSSRSNSPINMSLPANTLQFQNSGTSFFNEPTPRDVLARSSRIKRRARRVASGYHCIWHYIRFRRDLGAGRSWGGRISSGWPNESTALEWYLESVVAVVLGDFVSCSVPVLRPTAPICFNCVLVTPNACSSRSAAYERPFFFAIALWIARESSR